MIANEQQKKRNALAETLFNTLQDNIIEGQNYTTAQQKLEKLVEMIRTDYPSLTLETHKSNTETEVTLCLSGRSFLVFSLMTTDGEDCFFSITPPLCETDILTQIPLLADLIETVCTLFKAKSSHGP